MSRKQRNGRQLLTRWCHSCMERGGKSRSKPVSNCLNHGTLVLNAVPGGSPCQRTPERTPSVHSNFKEVDLVSFGFATDGLQKGPVTISALNLHFASQIPGEIKHWKNDKCDLVAGDDVTCFQINKVTRDPSCGGWGFRGYGKAPNVPPMVERCCRRDFDVSFQVLHDAVLARAVKPVNTVEADWEARAPRTLVQTKSWWDLPSTWPKRAN